MNKKFAKIVSTYQSINIMLHAGSTMDVVDLGWVVEKLKYFANPHMDSSSFYIHRISVSNIRIQNICFRGFRDRQ